MVTCPAVVPVEYVFPMYSFKIVTPLVETTGALSPSVSTYKVSPVVPVRFGVQLVFTLKLVDVGKAGPGCRHRGIRGGWPSLTEWRRHVSNCNKSIHAIVPSVTI